ERARLQRVSGLPARVRRVVRGDGGAGVEAGIEGRPVEIRTPLVDLGKADIVRLGVSVGAPLELTWSCYRGADRPCRECDSCALRAKGFAEAGVDDPAP